MDDARSEPDETARHRPEPDGGAAEASGRADHSVTKNIERVADKVKGLLRPDG